MGLWVVGGGKGNSGCGGVLWLRILLGFSAAFWHQEPGIFATSIQLLVERYPISMFSTQASGLQRFH